MARPKWSKLWSKAHLNRAYLQVHEHWAWKKLYWILRQLDTSWRGIASDRQQRRPLFCWRECQIPKGPSKCPEKSELYNQSWRKGWNCRKDRRRKDNSRQHAPGNNIYLRRNHPDWRDSYRPASFEISSPISHHDRPGANAYQGLFQVEPRHD